MTSGNFQRGSGAISAKPSTQRNRERRTPQQNRSRDSAGASVMEIVDRHDTNTYRAVYTANFARALYVLHAFQKKSKRGISTPQKDINLIKQRLAIARQHDKERQG